MDIFLMVEKLAKGVEIYNYWVGNNGLYDHILILIQLEKEDRKPPCPFKYDHDWLDRNILDFLLQKMEIL